MLRCGLQAARAMVADEPFEMDLAKALCRTVGADSAVVNMWRGRPHATPILTVAGQPPIPAGELDAWTNQFADHPYFTHLLTTGDPHAYRTSDFMPMRRFRQTAVYRELLAHYRLPHHLIVTLRLTDEDLVIVGLLRSLHDFSDREVGAVEQLRRPLSVALACQEEMHAIQARIPPEALHGAPGDLRLTQRENQVLALVATGYTNDQAARRLGISTRTIRKHLEAVFAKAHVTNRAAAVAYWLQNSPDKK
jgi:DNA-binding CsgD family transcriptional regulator